MALSGTHISETGPIGSDFDGPTVEKVVLSGPKWQSWPHAAAYCSAPGGPIGLKFCVVNGLEYGYKPFKFCWDVSRYVGVAVEKPSKTKNFCWPVHACIYMRSSVKNIEKCILKENTTVVSNQKLSHENVLIVCMRH